MNFLSTPTTNSFQPTFDEMARSLFELTSADQLFVYRRYEVSGPFDPMLALGALSLQEKQSFWSSQFTPSDALLDTQPQNLTQEHEQLRALDPGSILAQLRARAWRIYPLAGREHTIGLVLVGWLSGPPNLPETQLSLAGILARSMALQIDNDRLYERLHQRAQQARITQEITLAILRRDSLPQILEFIASEGIRALDALGCCIWLFDEGSRLQPAVQVGRPFASPLDPHSPNAQNREHLLHQQEPLVLAAPPEPDSSEENALLLIIPLLSSQRPIGFLEINQVEAYYQPRDLTAAVSFAGQAALAVELAWLYQRLQQTAVAEERARLARDLHDSISQSVYAMTLYTRAAQRQLEESNLPSVDQYLKELNTTARQVLGEMRLLIYELRPMALERYGLKGILEQRLLSVEARSGLEYSLDFDLPAALPARIEENFYHIALEALNNTIKHAQASRVAVTIRYTPGALHLEIHDNGAGFDPAEESGGLGLKSIQERVALLHGQLTIETRPASGVAIHVEVPYDQDSNPDRR